MAQTMVWPPKRTPQGGVALTKTPEASTEQSIILALLPGWSANGWEHQDGIGYEASVYEIASADLTPEERDRVSRLFTALERERRAKLRSVSVTVDGGTRRLVVEYTDLETTTKHAVEA